MRSTWARLAYRSEIGLCIGEHELAACQVSTTPIGRVVVGRARKEYEPDGLAAALQELLAGLTTRKDLARSKIYVGLPAQRMFFSTRPIQADNREETPEVLLHEVLQSPSLNIDDMAVDMMKVKSGQRQLASIVACRKKYLSSIVGALEACEARPTRVEPSPCALIREAARRHRPPGKSRAWIRVFLGVDQGLAVLLTGSEMPLMLRSFSLPGGCEEAAILAAVGPLRIMTGFCGLEAEADAILIHGRPDLGPMDKIGEGQALTGMRILRHDAPELDGATIAHGLAEGQQPDVEGLNLVRSTGPGASFLEIFPWGQAALQVVALVVATFFLRAHLNDAHDRAAVMAREDAKYAWAVKLAPEKLQAEKKDLENQVDAIRKFLETRILWTSYTRDIADRLADDLAMGAFQGENELEGKNGRPKRLLKLRLYTPIPKTGAMPGEIDAFLRTLRDDPLLKQTFPDIEVGELRWNQQAVGIPTAVFTVICKPTARSAEPPKAPAAAKKKAK